MSRRQGAALVAALLVLVAVVLAEATASLPVQDSADAVPRPGPMCRCPQQELSAYYEEASEVVMARLTGADEHSENQRRLRMEVLAPAWKTAASETDRTLRPGDTVTYRTARSTATCGVQPVEGAVYLVFAHPDADGERRVDTCSGTRIHSGGGTEGGDGGFVDVPSRFVVSRLDALSGLDALRGVAAAAPDSADPGNASMVGLLDLEPLAHGGVVRVRDAPGEDATVLTTIDGYEDVVSREVGYEVGAAVVLARRDGWSRVRLDDGTSGWIAGEEAGTWFPYAELPIRRLAYLTGSWSGHVWPDPGAGNPARSARAGDLRGKVPVTVEESRTVGGLPWFRVAILSSNPCEGPEEAAPELSGWVPGYGADGEPTVWYWSRGC